MVLFSRRQGLLLILTFVAYQTVIFAEELSVELQLNPSNGAGLLSNTETSEFLDLPEHQLEPATEIHRSTAGRTEDGDFFPRFRRNPTGTIDRKPEAGNLARKDEGSNAIVDAGWGLFSSISGALSPPEPPRKRKPIEDIPIIGSLVSLGGAIELAGRRSADLITDGTRKFGDLAVGSFSKKGYKYPRVGVGAGAGGLAGAVGGLGQLSPTDLVTVASALSHSKGRTDFVKQLLDKSTPETAFRLGQAAASVTELKRNPAFGALFRQFARRK